MQDLLQSNKLKFKSEAKKKDYERRVAIYDKDVRGEEMLTIASEMLAEAQVYDSSGDFTNYDIGASNWEPVNA